MDDRFKAYRITNRLNGRVYIGITGMALKRRWQAHVSFAGRGGRGPLLAAIRKYGPEAFTLEHIASAICWADLCEAETLLIAQHDSFRAGYNATKGGEGTVGVVWSEETKRIRAESYRRTLAAQGGCKLKGRPRGPEVSARLSRALKGRVFSEESRARMSAAQKRRVFTAAEKERFRLAGAPHRAASRRLTDEQVSFMRSQRGEGVRLSDLAIFYGLKEASVHNVTLGRVYQHVPMPDWMPRYAQRL